MNLKNKRYRYFLLFCADLEKEPDELALVIESMSVNQSVMVSEKRLCLDKITETIYGVLYFVSLYDDMGTQIRHNPIYTRKPPKRKRRLIAQIQAAVMIIAIVLITGMMTYAITLEQNEILSYDVSCIITQKDLYYTGNGVAFLVLGIANTGNQDIDVTMQFVDDNYNTTIHNIGIVIPSQTVQQQIPLDALISEGKTYIIQITGTTARDTVDCSEQVTVK